MVPTAKKIYRIKYGTNRNYRIEYRIPIRAHFHGGNGETLTFKLA